MKTRFLFWNLRRKPLKQLLRKLLDSHDVDFVTLAECDLTDYDLLTAINHDAVRQFEITDRLSSHFVFLSALPSGTVVPRLDGPGISIRRISPPLSDDILFVALHLPSKMYLDRDEQSLLCTRVGREIDQAERLIGHRRTVVMGDLNMNPFETGVVAGDGLHALSDRRVVMERSRVVNGERRYFFYNPMWGLLGDVDGPPGTYFYNSGTQLNYYWHTFDQILIRPDLLERFDRGDLRIHVSAGDVPLLRESGRPDAVSASDHLPISFSLMLLMEAYG